MFRKQPLNIFSKSLHIYAFYNYLGAPARYGAMSQALYFRNGCNNLHMRYTIEKHIKWSKIIGGDLFRCAK